MSTSPKGAKVPAFKLCHGGAPSSWHQVNGLPGLFHPEIPVPVGGDGDLLTLEAAEEFIAAHAAEVEKARAAWDEFEAERVEDGLRDAPIPFEEPPCPVELVRVTEKQADDAREELQVALGASRKAVRAARRRAKGDNDGALLEQAKDEQAAVSGSKEG